MNDDRKLIQAAEDLLELYHQFSRPNTRRLYRDFIDQIDFKAWEIYAE